MTVCDQALPLRGYHHGWSYLTEVALAMFPGLAHRPPHEQISLL